MKKRPVISRWHKRYRQGDIALKQVKKLPKWALPVAVGPLALGEVTGHAHRFEGGSIRFFGNSITRFIEVIESANLVHEEHATLTIPPGVYEQLGEREYDHINERPMVDYD